MKITMQAVLNNVNEEQSREMDKLMTVFCSAVRYSFRRINEGMETGDIEKSTADKYGLNIRQAKDAVKKATQIISSQKELTKINYDNYTKKVKVIENRLKKSKLSKKKKQGLLSKLEKRQRKQAYFKSFIDNGTIPPVTFGTKQLFIKRCKGLITHEEWVNARTNRIYSRGDKTKKGNPNLRVVLLNKESYLEISTLNKTETNRAIKIQVPIYLPQKLSKKTGRVNGIPYKEMFLEYLETGEAYQVEIIRKEGKYYCNITFEMPEPELKYTGHSGIIGVDTNPDGFALTMIGNDGNYKEHTYLKQHELQYARSNKRKNLCGELCKKVVEVAKEKGLGVAAEDLKFRRDKDVNSKFSRITHQFIYHTLLIMLRMACLREGIEFVEVKPQYTSKIGLYKYCHQYGMVVHNGAAMVIGRRSYKLKEKIPKILKDKFIQDKDEYYKWNEWKKWSALDKNIKRKGVNNPGFWSGNRKKLLRIDFDIA
jgi:IS605 OrfB family transposase